MKKIKFKILEKAKELFNERGVSTVSIREISREVGISHSNLIYHFKDKNDLLIHLHQQILDAAIQLNTDVSKEDNSLKSIFISTISGFEIMYDFRFFMIDFNYILNENKELHGLIKEIERLRFKMYDEKITNMIQEKIFRKESYKNEYENLIMQIRVFSDYWLSSSHVYDDNPHLRIKKYVGIFLNQFYPYLTKKGKIIFEELISEYGI